MKKVGQRESGQKRRRGRPAGKTFHERILLLVTADMAKDIDRALKPNQSRLDWIRQAIADRLKKR